MENTFVVPDIEEIRLAVAHFNMGQLTRLSELSGVALTTLHKIARSKTENPGIETVRAFVPHIAEAAKA
jgi:hypothetical protein